MAKPFDPYAGLRLVQEEEEVIPPAVEEPVEEVQPAVFDPYAGLRVDDDTLSPEDLLPQPPNKLMIQK